MKRTVTAMALALCLAFSQFAHAGGIPVFDASQEIHALDQLANMILQLKQMEAQYKQLENTYKSMTGSRDGFGNVFNDNKYKNYLPENYQDAYDKIRDNGSGGLTTDGTNVLKSNKIDKDVMCQKLGDKQKSACQRQVALAAQDRVFSSEAYDKAKGRYERIQTLISKISGADDQKAILELSARIQAEQTLIQNEALKLQIYRMVAESERRLAEQQAHSANSTSMNTNRSTGGTNIKFDRTKWNQN